TRGANLGDSSVYITHRNINRVILSIVGVPRTLVAEYCVELPFLGRHGTLSIFTCVV
ncbi:hypothetical protein PAXRUDRAFT_147740, partial [Paxillus rubicundulus Ve08.2h10]